MGLLERVARAIAQVDHNGRVAEEGYWSNRDTGSNHHRAQARAALEAMAEPSEAMLDRFVSRALCVSVHGEGGWSDYARGQWRTMIQAALDE